MNLTLDPRANVGTLTIAKQQMVEIAKALSFRSRVLIMDEPTAALTDAEIEDDEADVPSPLPAGTRNYITPRGFHALRDELRQLRRVERPKVVEVVSWAAGNGDRSENGDYLYGKKRLREIDRRIRFILKRLEIAEVVDPAQPPVNINRKNMVTAKVPHSQ